MNAFVALPNAFNWTPQQLAEAVPLRLHEALAFDALDSDTLPAANGLRHRLPATGYLPSRASLPQFRIS